MIYQIRRFEEKIKYISIIKFDICVYEPASRLNSWIDLPVVPRSCNNGGTTEANFVTAEQIYRFKRTDVFNPLLETFIFVLIGSVCGNYEA